MNKITSENCFDAMTDANTAESAEKKYFKTTYR